MKAPHARPWSVAAALAIGAPGWAMANLGCSAEATAPPHRPVTTSKLSSSQRSPLDADVATKAEAPTTDILALLASSLAPGMREAARGESPLPASIAIPPADSDVCVRAVLAASGPIVASLESASRMLALSKAGARVELDDRGPVCFKRGTSARIEVQGADGPVRYVLWMTP